MGKAKPDIRDMTQKEILEGVDAVGTIVNEDLSKMNSRMEEMTASLSRIHDTLKQFKFTQNNLENNQTDIIDTLKNMSDKLNRIEVRIAEGFQKKEFEIADSE